MSAGAFQTYLYQTDQNEVAPIKLQPETVALTIGGNTNDPATGPRTVRTFVRANKGNQEYGRRARALTVRFTGTVPTGYKTGQTYTVPVLTPAFLAGIGPGDTGTYLGEAIEVVSTRAETER